jgi:hypothetical protein
MPFLPAPGPPKNKYPSPYSPLFTENPRRVVLGNLHSPVLRLSDIIQSEERKLCRPPLRREGAFMGRGPWMQIMSLAALGVAALVAMAVITLTERSQYLEFAIAMVLFIAVLVGSYWFLLAPARQGEEQDDE